MEAEPTGTYSALVVRIEPTGNGTWFVYVDGTGDERVFALRPATFVVRLWRTTTTGTLRGSIQLHGSERTAPLQTNEQLTTLLHAWLDGGNPPATT